jgi:hypothetical protein
MLHTVHTVYTVHTVHTVYMVTRYPCSLEEDRNIYSALVPCCSTPQLICCFEFAVGACLHASASDVLLPLYIMYYSYILYK